MALEKVYDFKKVEEKWRKIWFKNNTYKWTENKYPKKNYIIDSSPPYPYTKLHAGNFFNYAYQDIMARYKRLSGFSVLQPWGWDCHGLPAEIYIENKLGKKAEEIGIEKFKQLCKENLLESIDSIKEQIKLLGISIDWDKQYITMSDEYKGFIQSTFLDMIEKKLIYRGNHPVSWCISCHSSIAEAQTDKKEKQGQIHYIKLPLKKGGHIKIATTRPELMSSCVGVFVHPDDKRYRKLVGQTVAIPFFNREVKIRTDRSVEPEFGTGIVYHCTFGDKEDYKWVMKYKLQVINSIDESGKMNENAGFLKGLKINEARRKIIEELKKEKLYVKSENVTHTISVCERCKTPLEILSKMQWFFATTKMLKKIEKTIPKMKWFPQYIHQRLKDWTDNILWDWVISRQRYWATPFPVWYCKDCNETIYAKKSELPVDPTTKKKKCGKCGRKTVPETDVMDTWMDSSVTPMWINKWMKGDMGQLSTLRPQGEDIIKTWLFYTMARCLAYDKLPFTEILINGMVLGTDNKKMSKRRPKTFVLPEQVIDEYGSDVYRQWAGKSLPGESWLIDKKEFEHSKKFLNKLWNIARFSEEWLENGKVDSENFSDKWILAKLDQVKKKYFEQMEQARWGISLELVRNFVWNEFASYYLEMIKKRLYEEKDVMAKRTLTKVLKESMLMLAPFTSFITEELFTNLFKKEGSIHLQTLEKPSKVDEKIVKKGELMKTVISNIRGLRTREKIKYSEKIIAEIPENLDKDMKETIMKTINASEIKKGSRYKISLTS